MIKVVLIATLAGFLIALSLGIATWYVQGQNAPPAGLVHVLDKASFWLWPTSIMLLPTENSGAFAAGVYLVISSIANSAVYAIVAFCVAMVWKKLFRASRLAPANKAT